MRSTKYANDGTTLQEVLKKAEAEAERALPPVAKDFGPVLVTLRAKGMAWAEICHWMQRETGLSRSTTFWKNLHTEETQKAGAKK